MISADSPLENTIERKAPVVSAKHSASLNEALQQVLKKFDVTGKNVVIRCETLPDYSAGVDEMAKVFDQLLSAVFNQPYIGTKLFLYVDCKERNDQPVSGKSASKMYEILIHTNIEAGESWRTQINAVLKNCQGILSRIHGTISMSSQSNKGCLFVISLHGKL